MSWTVNASINWGGFENVRTYGQKPDGTIVEWQYNPVGGWTGPSDLPGRADAGTPMSAIVYTDGNGVHIRVFYHAEDRIKELTWENNSWNAGSVLP